MLGASAAALIFCAFCWPLGIRSESLAGFDAASASSVYSTGFSADQALRTGSSYWCSSGNHGAGQVVTWTGVVDVRRKTAGVKLNWAYAPGEYKVLVSSDGGNFEEAACWRSSSRSEVSYQETVLFKNVQSAKAVAIVMKAPMPWGYFGLNGVRLLTEGDEAFMIVKGSPSHNLEECLVVSGRGISAQTCLDAVAGGDGRDVFKFAGANLVHAASGLCVAFARGAGNQVSLQDCAVAARAQDGRASWELTAGGQIKLMRMGSYCLSVVSGRAVVSDCGESLQKFAFVVVPEMALNSVALAQDQAMLLAAAAKRQRRALNDLQAEFSSLGACKFAISFSKMPENYKKGTAARSSEQLLAVQKANGRLDDAVDAIGRIYSAMGLDMANVMQLIGESSNVLEAAQTKLSHSA